MLPAGGGDEQLVTSSGPSGSSGWSPDGKSILTGLGRGTPRRFGPALLPLSAAPHAESEVRMVTWDPEYNTYAHQVSPDGRWICMNVTPARGGTSSAIHVLPATAESVTVDAHTPITTGEYWDDKPRWAPDGKTIYFVSTRGGFLNVWGIRFDPDEGRPTGEPFQVTDFQNPAHLIFNSVAALDVSLCEDRLVLPITEVSGNIWMLQNVDQ